MRNDLNGTAEIVPTTLFLDHALVDLASRKVVSLAHFGTGETFVMAQIEIGFRAVFSNKDLAMLKRTHGAWIHIDVGIQLKHRYF